MTEEHVDLTELFNRDPMTMTNEHIDQIIDAMRKKRHLFKNAPASGAAPKQLTEKQKKAVKLDLGDIDLKI